MPPHMRQLIGTVTLQEIKRKRSSKSRTSDVKLSRLEAEIASGRCSVILTASGEAERAVSLAALHVTQKDGRLLVRLGAYDDGKLEPKCDLPGSVQQHGESPVK